VGDTVTISGKDFAPLLDENSVRFANFVMSATPFDGTTTRLSVVVPAFAASGPLRVRVDGNREDGVGPELQITGRGIGDVWIFQGTGPDQPLKVPSPVSGTEYLIVPYASNAQRPFSEVFGFSIDANEASSVVPPPAVAQTVGTVTARETFEARRHRATEELLATVGLPEHPKPVAGPVAAPAATRQFNVLANFSGSTFARITAELKYSGAQCLVYADVDTMSGGNLTHDDFRNFADAFDNNIHPTNTTYFGVESDVDGNGKVIILVTPVVNRIDVPGEGFVAGFFLSNDLFPPTQVPANTTNHAEIFYVLAALSPNFPRAAVAAENPKTIAHEYEHLISFSHRIFREGGVTQITWLEEGMAHMAEDLNGDNTSNMGRASDYLRLDPNESLPFRDFRPSLEFNSGGPPLEQRGGIYLFLRWLGDRFGEDIYKEIVESRCVGRACIESITGESFYITVGDFFATLYLSGRGINNTDKYNFQSIDLSDFSALTVTNRFVGGTAVSGQVMRSAGAFYLFTNTTTEANEFIFNAPVAAGLRAVVVRTR
jgi:hypothetical protein